MQLKRFALACAMLAACSRRELPTTANAPPPDAATPRAYKYPPPHLAECEQATRENALGPMELFEKQRKRCEIVGDGTLDLRACALFAILLRNGCGTTPDPRRAHELDKRMCAVGNEMACTQLGWDAWFNEDVAAAKQALEPACKREAPSACALLAAVVLEEDLPRAIKLLEHSCDEGRGCERLGRLYLTGHGVSPDKQRANDLFRRACQAGVAEGCRQAAELALERKETRSDAFGLFDEGCHNGSGESCRRKADLYREQRPNEDARLVEYEKQGCAWGDTISCYRLAIRFRYGRHVAKDPARALGYARDACNGGFDGACATAGELLETQDPSAHAEALLLYKRACEAKDSGGCYDYGLAIWNEGSKPGATPKEGGRAGREALPWLDRGCALGAEPACKLSALLKKQLPLFDP